MKCCITGMKKNDNIEGFLNNPPSVDKFKKLFKMITAPITPEYYAFEIQVTSAKCHDSLFHAIQLS